MNLPVSFHHLLQVPQEMIKRTHRLAVRGPNWECRYSQKSLRFLITLYWTTATATTILMSCSAFCRGVTIRPMKWKRDNYKWDYDGRMGQSVLFPIVGHLRIPIEIGLWLEQLEISLLHYWCSNYAFKSCRIFAKGINFFSKIPPRNLTTKIMTTHRHELVLTQIWWNNLILFWTSKIYDIFEKRLNLKKDLKNLRICRFEDFKT